MVFIFSIDKIVFYCIKKTMIIFYVRKVFLFIKKCVKLGGIVNVSKTFRKKHFG